MMGFVGAAPSGGAQKILCVGDSITAGYPLGQNGGYRLPLQNIMRSEGRSYRFLGTQYSLSENMTEPYYEGYPGMRLDQVRDILAARVLDTPDVVLLHIGTNDFYQAYDTVALSARLDVWIAELCARWTSAYVIVSTIGPFSGIFSGLDPSAYNAHILLLPTTHQNSARILVADIGGTYLTTGGLADGLHPNDFGYQLMSFGWWSQLQTIAPPSEGGGDMERSIYDVNSNNVVDAIETIAWAAITGKPATEDDYRIGAMRVFR
jgi:lysophospholipase L1-like esterase